MAMQRVRRYHPAVDGYLTLEEFAAYLGVTSTGSLRVQIKRGAIKAERVGKKTYIVSKAEAERYKMQRRAGPGHPTKTTNTTTTTENALGSPTSRDDTESGH